MRTSANILAISAMGLCLVAVASIFFTTQLTSTNGAIQLRLEGTSLLILWIDADAIASALPIDKPGFHIESRSERDGTEVLPSWSRWKPYNTVVLPLASTVVLLACVGGGLEYCHRRRKPHQACPGCGYDLTGNVSGRCPECGNSIPEELMQDIPKQ